MSEGIKEYFIHNSTMALIPIWLKGNELGTKVLEEGGELIVHCKPLTIITSSCMYYGSSYKGRKDATMELIHINRKPPIAINPLDNLYFFPSLSPTQEQCGWFSQSHIANFRKSAYNQSEITFLNGKKIVYGISKNTLEVQLSRTSILQSVLSKHFGTARKSPYRHHSRMNLSFISEEHNHL